MTVSAETNRKVYTCNGVLTDFAFDFKIFSEDDLQVMVVDSGNNETVLEITTDYTVAGENGKFENGGVVSTVKEVDGTMGPYAWPSGYKIVIMLNLTLDQGTDLLYGGRFNAQSIERMCDRLTKICQQLNDAINRSVVLSAASALSGLTIPDLIAGRYLYAADEETLGWAVSVDTTALTVSDWAKTLLDDVNAEAALGTLGFSTFFKTLIDDTDSPTALKTLLALLHSSVDKTANYTVVAADRGKLINFDCTAGNLACDLPEAATAGNGFAIAIKKTDSSGYYIDICPDGDEEIDGNADHIIRLQNSVVICVCDGTGWKTVANNEVTGAMCVDALKDPAADTPGLRTLGTGAQQACAGNDARLSDTRIPLDNSVTAAKLAANKSVYLSDPSSSTPLQITSDSTKSTTSTSYVKLKEIKIPKGGTLRIAFSVGTVGTTATAYGRIYRNGSAVGTERSGTNGSFEFFEDISGWTENDLCQIYGRMTGYNGPATVSGFKIYSSEYQITL